MTGAVRTSSAVTAKPASASAAAIDARLREVVLVTRASGSAASRSRSSAATAPSSGRHDTVSTPSMSISTAPVRRMPVCPIRSVPQDPQALRFALSDVTPAVDPAAGGEKRLTAPEHRPARSEQDLNEAADHPDELGALVGERGLDGRRPWQ